MTVAIESLISPIYYKDCLFARVYCLSFLFKKVGGYVPNVHYYTYATILHFANETNIPLQAARKVNLLFSSTSLVHHILPIFRL